LQVKTEVREKEKPVVLIKVIKLIFTLIQNPDFSVSTTHVKSEVEVS